jgi:hypothetical protein
MKPARLQDADSSVGDIGTYAMADAVVGLEKDAGEVRKGLWADSRVLPWGHSVPGHFISPNPHLAHARYLEEYAA